MNTLELPCNVSAEKTILGAIMLDNAAYDEAASILDTSDFSLDSHQRIFLRAGELMEACQAVDIVTLANELARYKEISTVGGVAYLASLTEDLPLRPVIADYIRIVKDKSLARRLMTIASSSIARASDGTETAVETVQAAIEQLQESAARVTARGIEVREILPQFAAALAREMDAPQGELLGASLLTPDIDRVTAGIMEGELCLLAGRPGSGKTEAGLQIALRNARKGKRVYIQSLEMSRTQLMRRLVRLLAKVPVAAMRDARLLRPNQRQDITNAYEELVDLPIQIDDTHELTYRDFRSRAVLAAKRWKADLIVVDYAQLIQVPRSRSIIEAAPKQAETLRHIARDYCRTVALAQIRRAPPNDLNLYPDIEMILGSSAFEQAAQIILLLHRTRGEQKTFTGEDFCFLGKMRELQQTETFGIKAEKWGELTDRRDEPAPNRKRND